MTLVGLVVVEGFCVVVGAGVMGLIMGPVALILRNVPIAVKTFAYDLPF
jgi:hypothetical protein